MEQGAINPQIITGVLILSGTLLGGIIAIVNTWILRIYAKKDDHEKSDLEFLKGAIFEARDFSVDYWMKTHSEEDTSRLESAIIGRLTFVGLLSKSVIKPIKNFADTDVKKEYVSFHRACSDGLAENLGPQPHRCRKIELTAHALFHKIIIHQRKNRGLIFSLRKLLSFFLSKHN